MSNYLDGYWHRLYRDKSRLRTWWKDKHWFKSCRVPGNGLDKKPACIQAFNKWHDRPQKSHQLYWRLHK